MAILKDVGGLFGFGKRGLTGKEREEMFNQSKPTLPTRMDTLEGGRGGRLRDSLQLGTQFDQPVQDSLGMLRQRAGQPISREEEQLQLQAQRADERARLGEIDRMRSRGVEGAAAQSAQARAQAEQNLAMRGGLSGGARERLAQSGMGQQLAAQQGVRSAADEARLGTLGQGDVSRAGIRSDEAMFRRGEASRRISELFGAESQERNAQLAREQFNIQNTLQQRRNQQLSDLERFKVEMAGYGAAQTGKAQMAAGGKK